MLLRARVWPLWPLCSPPLCSLPFLCALDPAKLTALDLLLVSQGGEESSRCNLPAAPPNSSPTPNSSPPRLPANRHRRRQQRPSCGASSGVRLFALRVSRTNIKLKESQYGMQYGTGAARNVCNLKRSECSPREAHIRLHFTVVVMDSCGPVWCYGPPWHP